MFIEKWRPYIVLSFQCIWLIKFHNLNNITCQVSSHKCLANHAQLIDL